MLKKLSGLLGLLLLLFAGLLLVNTFRAKEWEANSQPVNLFPLPDSAILHMSQAIQIPTISARENSPVDTPAFKGFASFLEQSYPLIHQQLTKTTVADFSLIFEWKGTNVALPPFVLMSHFDVVPVEEAVLNKWSAPPFSGKVTDNCIWGRGALDDKFGVISIMEGVEAMLRKGFKPARTIYLCFGHDEEIRGSGAAAIVKWMEERSIKPEMVLDEGGQVSVEKTREISRPVAVIGVAEKGYASFELRVLKEGGHSSTPAKETAIDILTAALHTLRTTESPAQLTPQLKEFLTRVGPSSKKFVNRMAAANLWAFGGVAASMVEKEPEGYAMMHTTIVPTILESGVKDNVIPSSAVAIINTRILTGDTKESVKAYLEKTIGDSRVQIFLKSDMAVDPSPATDPQSGAFRRVASAAMKTVPGVIPAPYQMVGATDSRFFRKISAGVVNFFPMTDAKGYHGIDERLPLIDLQRGIHFIRVLLEESGLEIK